MPVRAWDCAELLVVVYLVVGQFFPEVLREFPGVSVHLGGLAIKFVRGEEVGPSSRIEEWCDRYKGRPRCLRGESEPYCGGGVVFSVS